MTERPDSSETLGAAQVQRRRGRILLDIHKTSHDCYGHQSIGSVIMLWVFAVLPLPIVLGAADDAGMGVRLCALLISLPCAFLAAFPMQCHHVFYGRADDVVHDGAFSPGGAGSLNKVSAGVNGMTRADPDGGVTSDEGRRPDMDGARDMGSTPEKGCVPEVASALDGSDGEGPRNHIRLERQWRCHGHVVRRRPVDLSRYTWLRVTARGKGEVRLELGNRQYLNYALASVIRAPEWHAMPFPLNMFVDSMSASSVDDATERLVELSAQVSALTGIEDRGLRTNY